MTIKTSVTEKTVVQKSTKTLVVCDLCGEEAPEGKWNFTGGYEHDAVKLTLRHDTYFPEGGGSNGVTYDCCPKCFREKVAPALEALGLKSREISSDW